MSGAVHRVRSGAFALAAAALVVLCIGATPVGAATSLQGDVRPGGPGLSATMTITPAAIAFPDSATIDMVATYGQRTWQPWTAGTCPGSSPFTDIVSSAPRVVAAWCIHTPDHSSPSSRLVPKGVATFAHEGRTYLLLNANAMLDSGTGLGYAQATLTRKPRGGQPAKVADIALNLADGRPIANHGGGIAVVGTKLYLGDGKSLRVFDLMKIGADHDSYGLLQERVYTSSANLFSSLSYDRKANQLVATSYGPDPSVSRPITFWALASNGYLKAPTATIRPARTMQTRTTEIKGLWVSGLTYAFATSQTSTGRLYVEDDADQHAPSAYAWSDEPAGLAQWSDGYLVSTTQPFWRDATHSTRTGATLFVFEEP
jgi:hypothetical protein